jgi:hypothetical protein
VYQAIDTRLTLNLVARGWISNFQVAATKILQRHVFHCYLKQQQYRHNGSNLFAHAVFKRLNICGLHNLLG